MCVVLTNKHLTAFCYGVNQQINEVILKGVGNPYIEEKQTTQWPKEKGQKDKQRSTKHTYKPIDRVTRTPLKTGGELRCSGRGNTIFQSLWFLSGFS
jgi:hypothetical protein